MADLSQSLARVSPLLTQVAIDYKNKTSDFVADLVLPRLTVDTETGIYFKYDKSALRNEDDIRADGENANRSQFGLTQVTYGPIEAHALWDKATERAARQFGGMAKLKNVTTTNLTQALMIRREVNVVAALTAGITQTVTLSGTNQWSDSSSTPVDAIKTARDTISLNALCIPNTLVLSYKAYSALLVHPQIVGRLNGISVAASQQQLANILGVEKIIVGAARYNTAKQGATDSLSYVWGNDAYLVYVAPTALDNAGELTLGHILELSGEEGLQVMEWREDRAKYDGVQVEMSYLPKIMAAEAGYRFINAVA